MSQYIEVIKNQFFSKTNLDFISQIIQNNNNSQKDSLVSNQILFNSCNKIFNEFIHDIYINNYSINPETLENILIDLNKLTIDDIQRLSNQHIQTTQESKSLHHKEHHTKNKKQIENNEQKEYHTENKKQIEHKEQKGQIEHKEQKGQIQIEQCNLTNKNRLYHEYKYIFSEDCEYNNATYKLQLKTNSFKTIKFKKVELFNNLYNITEHNNKFNICEKNIRKKISIPIGCYDLNELISTIQNLLGDKSNIVISYNKNKNRIYIQGDSPFSLEFIENDNVFIPLRYMLGFDKKEYMNNNNYCSNKIPILNIYDNIYIKIIPQGGLDSNINKNSCENFEFFERLSFSHIKTFGETVDINIDKFIDINQIDNIIIEFYYRHITHQKFYKICDKLQFMIIFDMEFIE